MIRKNIEHVVGLLVIVALFASGTIACGFYIMGNSERQKGAIALVIGLGLLTAMWLWIAKDRSPGYSLQEDHLSDDDRAARPFVEGGDSVNV